MRVVDRKLQKEKCAHCNKTVILKTLIYDASVMAESEKCSCPYCNKELPIKAYKNEMIIAYKDEDNNAMN